ncbi:hypothetical protein BDP81DRAFT_19746 [Colletotrichum phormii]|uniref:Uncharacterized protein n=1 Tax=Colletotrichum phormii TaxID=359342 RepID=A0AAJ0A766_9PEZI|nr:uncharacterized protein BDP81DRAFT_19746 [Colletotrichum phormii]KAK1656321.1 hypothetical protein BDP81DRAFT_19746 [Colletotrichum phormii]
METLPRNSFQNFRTYPHRFFFSIPKIVRAFVIATRYPPWNQVASFEITCPTAISSNVENYLQPTKTHLSPGYGCGYTQGANHHIFRILAGTSPLEQCLEVPTTDRKELEISGVRPCKSTLTSRLSRLDLPFACQHQSNLHQSAIPRPLSCQSQS